MMHAKLTVGAIAARARGMTDWKRMLALAIVPMALVPGGCITVSAPDKPIVIELNINIRQEVVYNFSIATKYTPTAVGGGTTTSTSGTGAAAPAAAGK